MRKTIFILIFLALSNSIFSQELKIGIPFTKELQNVFTPIVNDTSIAKNPQDFYFLNDKWDEITVTVENGIINGISYTQNNFTQLSDAERTAFMDKILAYCVTIGYRDSYIFGSVLGIVKPNSDEGLIVMFHSNEAHITIAKDARLIIQRQKKD